MTRTTFLDFASATPMDSRVIAVMKPFFKDKFYNPSANSLHSKTVKQDLESARSKVANLLGARPTEIIFTAGGTEANNLAFFGVCGLQKPGHIITTALEHESVLAPAHQLVKKGWKVSEIKPDKSGLVDVSKIVEAITDETVLVSVMYANNEVGTIQPIKQIAGAIQTIKRQRKKQSNEMPIYLHTDAAQATNYLDIHVNNLGVDLMTLNGGKIYGPKQSGILYVKTGVALAPLIFGGGQEWGLRSGTENVASCIGFAEALNIADNMRKKEVKRLKELQRYGLNLLNKMLPEIQINGSTKYRLPNNIHITIPGQDNESLIYALEEKGVICAAGSACSASKDEASHVLLSMGMTEPDIRASLRLSFGRSTTKKDIDKFIACLKQLL